MTAFISFIFIAGLVIFFISAAVVVFHFAHYRIGKRQHQVIIFVFVAGALALMGGELLLFSSIQWEAVNEIITNHFMPSGL